MKLDPKAVAFACKFVFSVIPLAGCSGAGELPDESEQIGQVAQSINWSPAPGWDSWANRPGGVVNGVTQIPVCWVREPNVVMGESFLHASDYTVAAWVRDQVESTWGRYASVVFTGWDTCPDAAAGGTVRVRLNNPVIGTTFRSSSNVGFHPSFATEVELNATNACTTSDFFPSLSRETCMRQIAVHEFGHVLGFSHEQAKPMNWVPQVVGCSIFGCADPFYHPYCDEFDSNGGDNPNTNGRTSDDFGTNYYDGYSVMNYCYKSSNLSPMDIVMVQSVYGRKPVGSLVGRGGRHLNVVSTPNLFGDRNGRLNLFETTGASAQVWAYSAQDGTLRTDAGDFCLDAASSSGWALSLANCATRQNQRWDFRNMLVRAYGGKCFDRAGGGTGDGTLVQSYHCHGEGNQRWTYMPNAVFRTGDGTGSPKCLDTFPGDAGQQLYINQCFEDDFQKFDLTDVGEIRVRESGLCLDVRGANPSDGAAIQLFPCKEATASDSTSRRLLLNQRFFFTTQSNLRSSANKCIDAAVSGLPANGLDVNINDCNGHPNQTWDYYFAN